MIKVKTLWEGHKIKKKSPTCLEIFSVASKQLENFFKLLLPFQKTWTLIQQSRQHFVKNCPQGPFNNYVDKMREGGQKMSVFVHSQVIKTVHAGRGVGQKFGKFLSTKLLRVFVPECCCTISPLGGGYIELKNEFLSFRSKINNEFSISYFY